VSLGCPKTSSTRGELGLAQQAGHELTRDAAERRRPRCEHVRVHRLGEAESIDAILEMAELKNGGAGKR